MKLLAAGALVLLLHTVTGQVFEFLDTSRESYSIGDDVTLTCPVTLCEGEDYKSVEWVYWACDRYSHSNSCRYWARWDRQTYSGPSDIELVPGITMQVPADQSVKSTLTIKDFGCNRSTYYHCRVIGTKGTDREHRHDVYPFRDASAEPMLTPKSIFIPESVNGSVHFACQDNAYVPGSSIRMYHVFWSFRATFTEVATTCVITYQPGACQEFARCTASFEMKTLRKHGTIPNTVQCDITRPGGKRLTVYTQIQSKNAPRI